MMKLHAWQHLAGRLIGACRKRTHAKRRALLPRLELLEDRTLLSASLVQDINRNTAGATPTNLVDVNGLLYFSATDNAGNIALYRSDGAASHTVRIKEFVPADPGGRAGLFNLTNVDGVLFFEVSDAATGRAELWESTGTAAGTRLVKNFAGDSLFNASGFSTSIRFKNEFFFIVQQPAFTNNLQLWKSDGAITTQVDPGAFSLSFAPEFTVANNTLYFVAGDPATGNNTKVWRTDGSDAGTQIADADITAVDVSGLTNLNGTLYFFAATDPTLQTINLYQSDGTHSTLIELGFGNVSGVQTAGVNGKLFFRANLPGSGFVLPELWVFDPANAADPPQNPRMLQPAHGSPSGLNPFNLTSVNGLLVFNGFDDAGDLEPVWVSDGTDAGTKVLFPNTAALALLFPADVAVANDTLYFGAQGPGSRQQLWQTDGTVAGTSMIVDFGRVTFTGGPPFDLTFSHGTLFFDATDQTHGAELWKSNLTAAGTQLVKDIDTNTLGSNPTNLVNADGALYFTADNGLNPGLGFGFNPAIWKTDGTAAGTHLVSTPFPTGGPSGADFPTSLVSVGSKVFFTAGNDSQLWITDGTSGGTMLLEDFSALTGFGSPPDNMTAVGHDLFFTIITASGDEQLWKSDGTTAGTVMVADNVNVQASLVVKGLYYFISFDPNTSNTELWESNGTAAGTHVVDPNHPGANVQGLTNVKGTLFYFDSGPNFNDETLWTTDGTTATLAAHIHPGDFAFAYDQVAVTHILYFAVTDETTGSAELWTSDGTAQGTGPVATVRPDFGSAAAVGSRLFFTVDDPANGAQLWVSDGTAAGTHLIAPIVAGIDALGNRLPFDLTSYQGHLYFTASDGKHGEELWQSNGTAAGTFRVQDIFPGPAGAMPSQLTVVGNTLFFTAVDRTHGTELWAFRPGECPNSDRPEWTDPTADGPIADSSGMHSEDRANRARRRPFPTPFST